MDIVDPRWSDAAHSTVTAEIDGETVTFAADPSNRHYAALLAGEAGIGQFQPPPPQVPEAVRRHQGLIALLSVGITEQMVRDRIALIEDVNQRELTRLRFEQPEWRRDSPFIAWGGAEFGLSAQQVDDLFVSAWSI